MKKNENFVLSTKKEKIFRAINIALTISMMLAGIGLAIYYKAVSDPNSRFVPSLGMLLYGAIPFAYELISRSKLPNSVFLIFNIYVAIAGLCGSALSGYKDFEWLDIVVHFVMGYLMGALALFFLCRSGEKQKMKKVTILLFCVFFSLFIESAWELCERATDLIFKLDIQGAWVEGENAPLLTDTIQDIACNMGGAILFGIHYAFAHIFKKDLGIFSMEKEFSVKHKLFEKTTISQKKKNADISVDEKKVKTRENESIIDNVESDNK